MLRIARFLLALAPLLSIVTGASAEDKPPIVLGQVGLSFYAVVGGVVQELLEREGHTVKIVEGSHEEIFPKLGAGEVDLLAAAWLPSGHARLYAPVEDVTFRIASLYDDGRFFWVVPAYVSEAEVSSISDLTKAPVKAKMSMRIVSLPEATGLTIGARQVMHAYGLDQAGYELVAGSLSDWLSTFREALAAKRWVVFPLWQPHWVNAAYDVRKLAEPQAVYGAPDTAYLLGHHQLKSKLSPQSLQLLSSVRFSIAAVTEMDRLVNVEGKTPRAAARAWMEANPDAFAR